MKIKHLKINGFGKLKEKEIQLTDSMNIIYGQNEAGKSTLLKFITSMFYGVSKNKNGGTIPEIEKYEPWDTEDFSGKISYQLDDGETYEVYRDFHKKNPQIFNAKAEDISKEFTMDKTKGNLFFEDQIGLEEENFSSSIITKQAEVQLDEKTQNTLIQKISNILGTGEDTNSYTSIVNKLKKKLNDEVGTSNTREKPINLIEHRIESLKREKEELEQYQENQFQIDRNINGSTSKIERLKKELEKLRSANLKKEKLKEDENKIQMHQEFIQNMQKDIAILEEEYKDNKQEKKKAFLKMKWIVIGILLILSVMSILFLKNKLLKWIMPALSCLVFVSLFIQWIKNRKEEKVVVQKQKERKQKIDVLEQNKKRQDKELKSMEDAYQQELKNIKKEYQIQNFETILEEMNQKQQEINEESITLHTLKVDKNQILPKLERLVGIEEELEDLLEQQEELERKRDNIKRALDAIETAYYQMKEQITPKFTEELSSAMKKIANGKYKSVMINKNSKLVVEQTDGKYITAENLSIGTIDQLYLALRLATIKEITKENMPIILDEAFAYFDNERLENILQYLASEYQNKQVIIFTCTDRECNALNKMKVNYQKIEL